ncbi:MAG: FAD-dependent oxidoreductase [Gemmatimonadales bacterium]|nr:FAD-dependent oxidoreductase [Gemmatimonadales bacterium]
MTGWAGGPAAGELSGRPCDEIAELALGSAAVVFGRDRSVIADGLRGIYLHDWSADPLARGAYSFGGVGASAARMVLAEAAGGRLFLAGEVLAPPGRAGTVHGAIASGHATMERLLSARPGSG